MRASIRERHLSALVVTSLTDVRYLSGFTGSNALVCITANRKYLVTDMRYALQAPQESPDWDIHIARDGSLLELLADLRPVRGLKTIGYDEQHTTVVQHRNMRSVLPRASFKRARGILAVLRETKAPEELASIRKAARLADRVFADVLERITPGMPERAIAAEITYRATLGGSEADPFPPIVVSGPRSALIHGQPSERKVRRGDLVIIDFGCTIDGYCSDMTRTIAIGGLSREKRNIYETVRRVQQETIAQARAGVSGRTLDSFARAGITNAGYGKYFTHALGHGIGLDVHEGPRISVRAEGPLAAGNVITIEPGIYVPGVGGVRIEDDIAIQSDGAEMLTNSPKDLIII